MPVGTGPYAVVRNNQNQLKIHAFEDYFGYRALIDEVNVWVLPEISEEPNGGLTLQGNTGKRKSGGESPGRGLLLPAVRLAKPAGGQRRGAPLAAYLFPARQPALPCGRTLPGQLVSRLRPAAALASRQQPRLREAGGAGDSHPYLLPRSRRTSGDRRIMRDLLTAHQVKLEIQELEYDAWHRGEVVSDIWLNSVNFTFTDRIFALRLSRTKSR